MFSLQKGHKIYVSEKSQIIFREEFWEPTNRHFRPTSFCSHLKLIYFPNKHRKTNIKNDKQQKTKTINKGTHNNKNNKKTNKQTKHLRRSNRKAPRKGGFWKEVFANIYASLGCGALSAKSTAGSNILGYLLLSWA